MRLPQFNAEASLSGAAGKYQESSAARGSGRAAVVPMLGKSCSNCEVVGGFGRIRGVGQRSCCQQTYVCDPKCHAVTSCWFESCTPEVAPSPWFSF